MKDRLSFRVKPHPCTMSISCLCALYGLTFHRRISMPKALICLYLNRQLHILVLTKGLCCLSATINLSRSVLLSSSSGRLPWAVCVVLWFCGELALSVEEGAWFWVWSCSIFSSFWWSSSFLMLCELALWGTLIRTPISFMLWEHGNLTTSQSYSFLIASGWHLTCEFGEHKLLDRANCIWAKYFSPGTLRFRDTKARL